MSHPLTVHITRWLVDLHAVEQQAIFALQRAGRVAAGTAVADDLQRHLAETCGHRAAVRQQLAARGRNGSAALDLAVTANRAGFVAYTTLAPDAPGKLIVDAFAYEFLEIAAYRMLSHAAERAGDDATQAVALQILAEEQEMAARVRGAFDWAVQASRERRAGRIADSVRAHLADAHAVETQTAVLLGLGSAVAGSRPLAAHYRAELRRTQGQRRRIAVRLGELGRGPSLVKTAGMGLAGAGWSLVWTAQRYTPAKLACFLHAAQHLEIACYELLRREAALAGDGATETVAAELLAEERTAAMTLAGLLPAAADAALSLTSRAA